MDRETWVSLLLSMMDELGWQFLLWPQFPSRVYIGWTKAGLLMQLFSAVKDQPMAFDRTYKVDKVELDSP